MDGWYFDLWTLVSLDLFIFFFFLFNQLDDNDLDGFSRERFLDLLEYLFGIGIDISAITTPISSRYSR